MKKSLVAMAALALVAGCAADTARFDAQDDATCQGRGLVPDSDSYKACRNDLQAGRAAQARPAAPYRSRMGGY
jgi:hypothetical protein